ncbi:MAG: molybdate ABC transporter substrate-binding protein [Ectobacillus sp.]
MNRFIRTAGVLLISFLLFAGLGCTKQEKTELTVSAAASLRDALTEIQKNYEKEQKNIKISFNFGSSGALLQQIEQGAPVDLFFSAAEDKFQVLVDKGIIRKEESKNLLSNELVLIVPKEKAAVEGFTSLKSKEVQKLALGMPESVPAGKYGKQLLASMGLWEELEKKVVYAKDVRQVLTYVETNNVDGGIVYKTDAQVSSKVKIVETAAKNTHDPIVYPLGIIRASKHKEEAKRFYQYLQTKQALEVFEKYGFQIEK